MPPSPTRTATSWSIRATRPLSAQHTASSGVVSGAIGWDGGSLVWLTEDAGFKAWRPGASALVSVQDEEIFRGRLRAVPAQWIVRPESGMLLVTSHSVVAYRLEHAGSEASFQIDGLLGGPVWRTVDHTGSLVAGRSQAAAPDPPGAWRTRAPLLRPRWQWPTVRGEWQWTRRDTGRGDRRGLSAEDRPAQLSSAVGEPKGGCWFSDRGGDIHFADPQGRVAHAARVGLEDVSGAQLVNCGESLVWSGLSSQLSETGNDYATTFVFFRKLGTHHMRLERVGMQVLPANEGSCTALWHNQSEDRLLTLWAIPDAGKDRHGLRFGSMEDWISGQFQETRIVGLGAFAFEQGALSADGRFLGLVSRSGEIFCVRLSDSRSGGDTRWQRALLCGGAGCGRLDILAGRWPVAAVFVFLDWR